MINAQGERALAHVESILALECIPNADKIEVCTVLGWKVVVRKDEFKVGDKVVYIEIDSKVPEREEFEFLRDRKFKVKTIKLRGQYSQGLVMPLSILGRDAEVGEDVTKELGIKYSVAEDNARKSNSVNKTAKYESMAARHKNLFKKKPFKWLMRRKWGRKLLFIFFGKKKDTPKGWPVGKFPGVSKTDQERCLPGGTKILTDRGIKTIASIVNGKLNVKVASMGNDGKLVYKKILDYQKFNNDTPLITIRYPYSPDCKRTNALCCTEDHMIFTERGYVKAKDLRIDDMVYIPQLTYSKEVLPIIYGMLLGDSHICDDKRTKGKLRVVATNGEKQMEYLKYKQSIFNNGKIVSSGRGTFNSECFHWFLETDAQISCAVRKDWYANNKKQITPAVCNMLNNASLAFWYMDDGSLTYRNPQQTAYFIRLNTQGFSLEENMMLSDTLATKFNINNKVNKDKLAKDGHQMYRIDISSTEESDKFMTLVAPYICDSMLYKLSNKFKNRELKQLKFEKENILFPIPVLSVEQGQTKNNTWSKNPSIVYDIEVEDTHNFIAENIVVHNCESMPWVLNDKTPYIVTQKCDGSSGTYILERKKHNKFEFYVCSRNVRMVNEEQICYYGSNNYYWEVAKKYDVENKMKKWLINHPEATFVCWQGEICAPNIQKNPHNLTKTHFYCFHWTDSINGRRSIVDAALDWASFDMEVVPIVDKNYILPDDFEAFKLSADGYYQASCCEGNDDCLREGFVYYKTTDPSFSFKNVSRKYLMAKGE